MCRAIYWMDAYARFQVHISKHVEKTQKTLCWRGALLSTHFRIFVATKGPKIAQPWRKAVRFKTIAMHVCVPNLKALYNFWGRNCRKILWPISGCKVDQSDLIVIKLLLDVWRCLPDVYAKFQIDISNHVQKSRENFSLAESSTNSPSQVFLSARGPKFAQL